MAIGTVKFFNTQTGFGFITPADGSRVVFVHISTVERAGIFEIVTDLSALTSCCHSCRPLGRGAEAVELPD